MLCRSLWGAAHRDARDRLHPGLRLLEDIRPVRGLQQHQRCDAARGIPRTASVVEQRRLLMIDFLPRSTTSRKTGDRILKSAAWQAQDAAPRPRRRQGQAMARRPALYQRISIPAQYSGLRIELLCHESQRLLSLHRPVQIRNRSDNMRKRKPEEGQEPGEGGARTARPVGSSRGRSSRPRTPHAPPGTPPPLAPLRPAPPDRGPDGRRLLQGCGRRWRGRGGGPRGAWSRAGAWRALAALTAAP